MPDFIKSGVPDFIKSGKKGARIAPLFSICPRFLNILGPDFLKSGPDFLKSGPDFLKSGPDFKKSESEYLKGGGRRRPWRER